MTHYTPSDLYRSAAPVSLVKKTDRLLGRGHNARLSNSYLKDSAKQVVALKFLQFVTVACLCVLIVLLANFSSVNYRVFATSREGTLESLPALDSEIGDSDLVLWVVDAVVSSSTMGFHDYNLRMLQNRAFFTDRGWESYNRFLRSTSTGQLSIFSNMEKGRMLMWGKLSSPPLIVSRALVGGVMTYRIRLDLTIKTEWIPTYYLPSRYELTVERVPPSINPRGLAISQWRAL